MAHLEAKSGGAPLFEHLLDVCAQAHEFLFAYQPNWPMAKEINFWRFMAYAALLHDFGKIHPSFQSDLSTGAASFNNRHEALSLAFLEWLDIPASEWPWLAATIATHHKSWYRIYQRYGNSEPSDTNDLSRLTRGIPDSDVALLYELLTLSSEVFAECGWPQFEAYPLTPYRPLNYREAVSKNLSAAQVLIASIAPPRQIRPGPPPPRNWTLVEAGIHARGWLLSSDHLASARKTNISSLLQSVTECHRLFPAFEWKKHQEAAAAFGGSGLLIAPTGSGKTEAALLWASRQAELGARGRLCVLLPYQASLNAMQRRLIKVLDPSAVNEPGRWATNIGLLHGRTSRHFYEAFLHADHAPDRAEKEARTQANLTRLFASPISLGTIFSLVRLLFATRGAERLFATYYGARIVVDEIHAYQPHITAMALAVLQFIQDRLNARVLLMSATVPRHLEQTLSEVLNTKRIIDPPPWSPTPRHKLTLLAVDCLSDVALSAICKASEHKSVLVVVNQVKRAISLRGRIAAKGVKTALLHSRFNHSDRAAIEENNLTPEKGKVLIATQAVEVSLDLNFGVCFSELAPIEAISQRFGRCNRDNKAATPADVYVFIKFPPNRGEHFPYDKNHLANSGDALARFARDGPRELFDKDIDDLLEASYPNELKQKLKAAIADKTQALKSAFLDDWTPFGVKNDEVARSLEKQWQDLFDGEEVLPESLILAALKAENHLAATRYLVPISAHHMARYRRDSEFRKDLGCTIIRRDYNEDGLQL